MTCSAATPKLTEEEIEERLTRLAGWSRAENWIEKKYEFKNFLRAMDYELGTTNFSSRERRWD